MSQRSEVRDLGIQIDITRLDEYALARCVFENRDLWEVRHDEGLELILGVAYRYTGEQLAVLKDELEDDWDDITEED